MKKYRAISLIETLISLAIVGIALIALMPVVTIKNVNNSSGLGNEYWNKTNDRDPACTSNPDNCSYAPNNICQNMDGANVDESQRICPIRIGEIGEVPNNDFLEIVNTGFVNSAIPAITVTERLHYNGQEIFADTIDNAAAKEPSVLFATQPYNVYNVNSILYCANDRVIIQNDAASDRRSIQYNYINNPKSKLTETKGEGYSRGNSIYKLSNQNNEYLFVSDDANIVGVGQNAASYKNLNNASGFIAIGNFGNFNLPAEAENINYKLIAIGPTNNNLNKYSEPSNYAMHYNGSNNTLTFGAGNLTVDTFIAQSIVIPSDRRLKNIIGKYKKGLNEILKINPVLYSLKSDKNNTPHVGVIAQDLQKIFPKSVRKNPLTGYLAVNQDETFYALLNAIKELDARNKTIEEENQKLEKKIAELRAIRNKIKTSKGGAQ